MKKYIIAISIFVFLIHTNLFAQTIELNEQVEKHSEVIKIHSLENNRWFVSGSINELDHSLFYFSIVDTSELIKTNDFLDGYAVKKLMIKDDFGFAWYINDYNGKDGVIRINIDSNSFNLFGQTDFFFNPTNEIINEMEILPNGKLMILGTKTIGSEQRAFFKILRENFVVDYEDYLTLGYYDKILINPNSSFILSGRLGSDLVYGVKSYDWNYQPQGDIIEFPEPDKIFRIGEEYFVLKNEILSSLDSNYQIASSISLEDYGQRIDLESDDENAFLLFQNEEEAPMILKINTELEVVDYFAVEDKYFRANDLHLSNDEIGIGGLLIPNIPFNNTPFLYPSTSGYFKTFSKNGISEEEDIELEIIDVRIDDYEKKYTCGAADLSDVYLLNLKNTRVSFVNKGTTTINDITLFIEAKGTESCVTSSFDPTYYTQREDIKLWLEPGDTIHWRISALEFPQKTVDSTSVELCVWHTSVENQRDQNPDNNYFCGEVELDISYVELPIVKPDDQVLIYPNPIKDLIKVSLKQAPFESTLIEFHDFLGRKLEQKYLIAPRAQYKEFDVSQIPSGFYFVRISNDLINEGVLVYVN